MSIYEVHIGVALTTDLKQWENNMLQQDDRIIMTNLAKVVSVLVVIMFTLIIAANIIAW